ncbi:hypothetical protein DPX16_4067 [Anabarilius grahami]|uniref:Uncharacterized protein n=1 Tax=Anabarilius grahami TaxID=495550 RepID=A0A3N0XYB3_ANAGA|nr:hypothetical protein DPX16_4067 [Anabarilius grahami]
MNVKAGGINAHCCSDRRLEVKKRSKIHTSNLGSLNEIISFRVSEVPIPAQGSERVHCVFRNRSESLGMNCTAATALIWPPSANQTHSEWSGRGYGSGAGAVSAVHRPEDFNRAGQTPN